MAFRIKPCLSSGVVLVHEDGKSFELAPFQVFKTKKNQTVIRIGRNTFWFAEDGTFDGTESKLDSLPVDEAQAVVDAYKEAEKLQGQPPADSYFEPGSTGYEAETMAWPKLN